MQIDCVYCGAGKRWGWAAVLGISMACSHAAPVPAVSGASEVAVLDEVTVVGQLDEARERIVPNTGAMVYTITREQIEGQAQGNNVPFGKLLLRFPGVSQDASGSGAVHIRDEHGNVQYRINDVLIPEGITGFGSEFDTRFADRVDLITGALPAQYGLRTTGIVDIHTKSGAFDPGGEVGMYGGSNGTVRPSFEYGGVAGKGKTNYYVSGSYLQNEMGIENPTASHTALHDDTEQYRGFAYLSRLLDDTSRVSVITGTAYNQFNIPDTAGLENDPGATFFPSTATPTYASSALHETQIEQNNYEIVAYQKTVDDLDFQAAAFNRYSNVSFRPDWAGDLYFNGVAGSLDRSIMTNGFQLDSRYRLTEAHTVRGGALFTAQGARQGAVTSVFATDATGAPTGDPYAVASRSYQNAYSYGLYLQDEWKVTKAWTVNFGGRLDLYEGQVSQNQISPRVNSTYEFNDRTTVHAGYASYFTPPPLENVNSATVSQFDGTTNSSSALVGLPNDPVRAERSHYFDAGIVHQVTKEYQIGLDGYYKIAQNLIDDGQFGAAPILTAFNYRRAEIAGVELSQNYTKGGFSAYGNVSLQQARGTGINSAQAPLFGTSQEGVDAYNYIAANKVYLDHDQRWTGSAGLSYLMNETRPYAELVVGSGLRKDGVDDNGVAVPNGGILDAYDNVNIGVEQTFRFAGAPNLKARFDIVNLFDQVYFLRDGSGIGVGAAQYGARRGFYGGITYSF
ncbi:Outer membrane receptor proteins, mostly Fe transport [Verrucomicrobium sp. GAS474]|uniref:TonB-dependent receptor n=1 Tax=Verrucomicrobium sp. GAS474 TaxID=1882831 RepID=UPI00087B5693|nr:TonB-dependent receptor [Verrucomicrobium sp. GAS474]SDU10953.1 Outer membrane receptor proteins, mostly Fe transport [Verrucomicrobium sp. GAS474]